MRFCSSWSTKMAKILPFTIILLLVSSFYLVFTKWDWEVPWIDASLVMLLMIAFSSIKIDLPRIKALDQAAHAETAITPSLALVAMGRDHVLWNSVSIMTMEVAAIIHIMIEKYGVISSILTLAAALLVGLIFSKTVLALANRLNPTVVKKHTINF